MTQFIVAPEAAQDIEEIVEHIAKDNVNAALEVEARFTNTFRRLAKFPNSGHSRPDLAEDRHILFWAEGMYLILYRIEERAIEIVAVLHSARDIPAVLHHRNSEP
jgi:plasmid stabilization system protein ParE